MRIAAAMSGGVDSALAAVLLKRQGHAVTGVHLLLREVEPDARTNCINPIHALDARRAAESNGIPFVELDLRECFEREIAQPFLQSYLAGETPNPCVACNARVKLGPLLDWARKQGFDKVATGHYARVEFDETSRRWRLRRGLDPNKDQSYYLAGLSQEQLAALIPPVGEQSKDETRRLAAEIGLNVADKPDSQDICLAAGGDYRGYLERRLGADGLPGPGPILNTKGERLGEHKGLASYTVGQRRGLGISYSQPLYVVELDVEKNALIVGEDEELMRDSMQVDDINWVGVAPPTGPIHAETQIRYRHTAAASTVHPENGCARVEFDKPQRAIAPGQIAVFYRDDILLGGGVILKK